MLDSETHLKVWQPPAPFVGTSTSRSTFEALRHEEGARPAAISTLSRKNPDWVGHKERAGIVDKRDWQSSHRADFRHFPGDNRAKRTEFVSASLKPPAEAEAMQLFDWLSTEQRAMYKPPPADFKRTGLAHSERAGARAEKAALLAASNSAPALQRKERPTSTYLEAFKDHRQPPLPLHHPEKQPTKFVPRFTGTSSYRDNFQGVFQPRQGLSAASDFIRARNAKIITHKPRDPPTSEHRAAFINWPAELMRLPQGELYDLGLQVVGPNLPGAQFMVMIPAATPAPAEKSIDLTTVVGGQKNAEIVVVARPRRGSGGAAKVLGQCSLGGISAASEGEPRVTVTFKLVRDEALKVTAFYHQGKKTRAITLKGALRKA